MVTLKALLRDTKVRAALVALAMALAAYFGWACTPSQTAAALRVKAAHDCYHAALEPALGDLTDEFLQAALSGGDLGKALVVHGLRPEEILLAATAFEACGRGAVESALPRAVPNGNTNL